MSLRRGWTIAVIAAAIVLVALDALQYFGSWRVVAVAGVSAALVLVWVLLGLRALRDDRFVAPTIVLVIALAGTDAAIDPSMSTIQCIAFPLIWVLIDRTAAIVVANIALAVVTGVGMFYGNGLTSIGLIVAIVIEVVSLAFSFALGLWITSIARGSDEKQRLLDELTATQDRLAVLSRETGAAAERERLALELHDTIAQDLAGMVLTAQRGLRELDAARLDDVRERLHLLEEAARATLAETRALVAAGAAVGNLGALGGEDGGLATALRRLGERMARETGIAVTVEAVDDIAIGRDAEVVLLRCAQEGLANVRKHSGARTASLVLRRSGEGAELAITDDGHGFDASAASTGFGLDGMRERLGLVNGSLDVSSAAAGTRLVATLPSGAA